MCSSSVKKIKKIRPIHSYSMHTHKQSTNARQCKFETFEFSGSKFIIYKHSQSVHAQYLSVRFTIPVGRRIHRNNVKIIFIKSEAGPFYYIVHTPVIDLLHWKPYCNSPTVSITRGLLFWLKVHTCTYTSTSIRVISNRDLGFHVGCFKRKH